MFDRREWRAYTERAELLSVQRAADSARRAEKASARDERQHAKEAARQAERLQKMQQRDEKVRRKKQRQRQDGLRRGRARLVAVGARLKSAFASRSSSRAIVLTSTFRRHHFVARRLADQMDVVGVWREQKSFEPQRYAVTDDDHATIAAHFASRDEAEARTSPATGSCASRPAPSTGSGRRTSSTIPRRSIGWRRSSRTSSWCSERVSCGSPSSIVSRDGSSTCIWAVPTSSRRRHELLAAGESRARIRRRHHSLSGRGHRYGRDDRARPTRHRAG